MKRELPSKKPCYNVPIQEYFKVPDEWETIHYDVYPQDYLQSMTTSELKRIWAVQDESTNTLYIFDPDKYQEWLLNEKKK